MSHATETKYLVRKAMKTGYQFASLLTPPVYTALILARRSRGALSINRLLRATWLGGVGGKVRLANPFLRLWSSKPGGLISGGLACGWYARSNEELVRTRRLQIAYDVPCLHRYQ